MTYTWGYLKENTLVKLNIEEAEANQLGFLSRFPYAANVAMTQICSGIQPKQKFFDFVVLDLNDAWSHLTKKHGIYLDETLPIKEVLDENEAFWKEWATFHFVNTPIDFPEDFVAFYDDVAEFKACPWSEFIEAHDDIFVYQGFNQVICKYPGHYKIPYSARWWFFTKNLLNHVVIPAPADILDALPSYIASQCLKIDDEPKSAIYRNEYEMFLARIDNTSFKAQRTFKVGGNW